MKIAEVHIYGYGKLENIHFNLERLQVFYGENEAGKSTIMSFIHSILFGFPTKQQSEPRYEPKYSSKYGGKLVCMFKKEGKVTIERLKGKATGDVTVTFEDGRVEGEKTLEKLLGNVDQQTYSAIFSFNLEGLQNIHRLKEEELNRYLFSAGAAGTDRLFQMETSWKKEMDTLFKKAGRKPTINKMLVELKQLEKEIKNTKEKNDQYTYLLNERKSMLKALEKADNDKEQYQNVHSSLVFLMENWELLEEYHTDSAKLASLQKKDFPVNGLERLNELKRESRVLEAYLETLLEKQELIQRKLDIHKQDSHLPEPIGQLQQYLDQQPLFIKWQDQIIDHEREIQQVTDKQKDIIRELGLGINVNDVPEIDTSLIVSEKINRFIDRKLTLENSKQVLMTSLETEKKELHKTEKQCEEIESQLLSEEEYKVLQQSVKQQSSVSSIRQQLDWTEQQIKSTNRNRHKKPSMSIGMPVAAILLLCMIAWGIIETNWLLSGLALSVFSFIVWNGYVNKSNRKQGDAHLVQLEKAADELRSKLTNEGKHSSSLQEQEEKLNKQVELRNNWKQLIIHLEQQQEKLQRIMKEKADMNVELEKVETEIETIRENLLLPTEFEWRWMKEAFHKIKELIGLFEKRERYLEEKNHLQEKVTNFQRKIEKSLLPLNISFVTVEEALIKLKSFLQEVEKKKMILERLSEEAEPLKVEIRQKETEKRKLVQEMEKLFKSAQATDEEEFRKIAEEAREREVLVQRQRMMNTQINRDIYNLYKTFSTKQDVEKAKKETERSLEAVLSTIKNNQKRLAEIKYELSILEEGNQHAETLHKFEEKKAELKELALQWSKYSMAQHVFQKTIHHYKETKLPQLIELSERNFYQLTDGKYNRVILQGEEMIEVEEAEGTRYKAIELSQGTKEQLYLAIRLALVQSFTETHPFPIIIDDGVVNFDLYRTEAFGKVIRKLEASNQIILLTCHSHVRDQFSKGEVVLMKKLTSKVANV
ncbi:ATP-binding protein [Bacillus seohaeanensis]|uniref:AAA family ATPase n=1 Tax=Bacillus seohaeanensis TaxID=284580 RepID=A0ABW5RQW8_9BACI